MAATRHITGDLLHAFKASYVAVLPKNIVNQNIYYNRNTDTLTVAKREISLTGRKLYLVGAGKGAQFLAREIDSMMGSRLEKGIVSIPEGSLDPRTKSYKIDYREGAKNNLPDKKAETSAKLIKKLAMSLTVNDVLMVLLTGGGSALLPLPIEPITLDEKTALIKELANSGADITELNTVRKRLSDIKGGKLSNCTPARIVSLVISDIVNDPLDLIASGPTVKNDDDPKIAIDILEKYNLYKHLPESIKGVLRKDCEDKDKILSPLKYENIVSHTKVNANNEFEQIGKKVPKAQVLNFLLASNLISVENAKAQLSLLNEKYMTDQQANRLYFPVTISRSVIGNVKNVAFEYFKLAQLFGDFLREKLGYQDLLAQIHKVNIQGINIECNMEMLASPNVKDRTMCLILAGETTVEVKGSGKGGRNQQLALEFSKLLHEHSEELDELDIHILSAGTDGIDGPTDAAGAFGHINLVSESIETGLNVDEYLDNNNSYSFYEKYNDGEYHIKTGHTYTNVMDIQLIAIQRI